ncbi:hypothetical protein, partial [uncultured Jatrophihabitans sp.]|uniref:hypothetical protein n=1 Tax=uncultured Jatrophihabitans sp. TaxID=1610747 RepID=UPI0035C9D896
SEEQSSQARSQPNRGQSRQVVLSEVLAQAYNLGAQTAVVEFRYVDADYRDEHSRFYSTTFRRYPSVAHRIHFFAETITEGARDPNVPLTFEGLTYLGYLVLRPVPGAPVGRVLLAPPPYLSGHVTCIATDRVNLFGEQHSIRGAPFLAQDAQLLRCAHAALWVVARHHHLRWGAPRRLSHDIVDAVPLESAAGRVVPSPGLTISQMSAAATRLGLPPLVYDLRHLPGHETLQRIACRYLNSGLPVIVAGRGHAFVLVGYRRTDEGTPDERIEFIRQDDEAGPYQVVPDFGVDTYTPWQFFIVPLPAKLYVAAEEAEVLGDLWLRLIFGREGGPVDRSSHALRTTAMLSNDFKAGLRARGVLDEQAATLRRTPMSRWVWIVELVDRSLRRAGRRAVIGEVVIDSTDHARDRRPLAWRTPSTVGVFGPDTRELRVASISSPASPVAFAN